jgi:hypothetical protein
MRGELRVIGVDHEELEYIDGSTETTRTMLKDYARRKEFDPAFLQD